MKILTARLKGVSPYSQSKHYQKELEPGESQDDNYRRTWGAQSSARRQERSRVHPADRLQELPVRGGQVHVDPGPRQGQGDVHENFEAGNSSRSLPLGIKAADVNFEALFPSLSDGKRRGGGKKGDEIFSGWLPNGRPTSSSSSSTRPSCRLRHWTRTGRCSTWCWKALENSSVSADSVRDRTGFTGGSMSSA